MAKRSNLRRSGPFVPRFALLLLFFSFSGATSLALEVVWVRLLTHVFGSTTPAIATVLGTFMGGLALGSWLGGRVADRLRRDPLWGYAICEFGVGLSAMIVPFVVTGYPELNAWLWGAFGDSPIALATLRCLLCALLLLPATTFMGATMPLLSRAAVLAPRDFESLGGRLAALYAFNTAGAVCGAVGAGLWLLPALGLSRLHWLAVIGALVVGGLAALVAAVRGEKPEWSSVVRPSDRTPDTRGSRFDARLVLAAFALSGAVAMALEVLFSRAFGLILGSATQSFSIVLGMFLLGLSLGAALLGRFASRTDDPLGWLGLVFTGCACAVIFALMRLDHLPETYLRLVANAGPTGGAGYGARMLVAATMAPVTFFLGAIMPLAVRAYVRSTGTVGRDVGAAYAANTVGAVLGSVGGGLLLLPLAGLVPGLIGCALLLLAVAALLVWRSPWTQLRWAHGIASVAIVGLLAVAAPGDPKVLGGGVYGAVSMGWKKIKRLIDERDLLYYRDGMASTVTVFRAPSGVISMRSNGKADGSTGADSKTQILLGLFPALLHPGDEAEAFVIGYGTGMTVGALTQAPNVVHVDVAEIEPAVYEAADRYFSPHAHEPDKNPRVQRFVDDGRNFLLARGDRYDLIVSEPPNPWMAGVASLFTREFYESAKLHLEPDGIFCQWVPLYDMGGETVRLVYRTFHASFPHVLIFDLGGDSLLIGTSSPLRIDLDRLEQRMGSATVAAELNRIGMGSAARLLGQVVLAGEGVGQYAGTGEINTDDNGVLEFAAQRDYYFSVSNTANARELNREVFSALQAGSALSRLDLDLGSGPERRRRAAELADELERRGHSALAQPWRRIELELSSGVDAGGRAP